MKRALLFVLLIACRQDEATSADPEIIVAPPNGPTAPDPTASAPRGYIGVLTPRELAEITAPFTSTIAELSVKLGDSVEKGQAVARLDDKPLRQELSVAEAQLRTSQSAVTRADVEQKSARAALDRATTQFNGGIVSHTEVTDAEFALKRAEASLGAAYAAVGEQRQRVANLNSRLLDTTLRAPLAGKVALIYAVSGARVEEGHAVLRVISSDELFVRFAIPADRAGTLKPGDALDMTLDNPGIHVGAVVRQVSPERDPVAQMIIAEADLVDPPAGLQSGSVCRIQRK
jgi:RND family efflux transporter MFP subunit